MIQTKKSSMRAMYRQRRRDMLKNSSDVQRKLQDQLLLFLQEQNAQGYWGAYKAMAEEANPEDALLTYSDVEWLFPRVESDNELSFRSVPSDGFCSGAFGVLEPKESCASIDPKKIEAYLIPGCAFDRSGNRLGMGKSFYDRYLQNNAEQALKVGLAFSCQIAEKSLPTEEHDVQMDWVITEAESYRCKELR